MPVFTLTVKIKAYHVIQSNVKLCSVSTENHVSCSFFPLLQLEDKLTAEKLIEWTCSQDTSKAHVDLHLPRFKVEENYDLTATMNALGVVQAFSPQDADFSGMTGSRGLMLSKIVHKSFVEVTEEGTEAAAATGIEIIPFSAPMYKMFRCDHPFLFFIKNSKTNSILFFGRVSSP